MNTLKRVEQLLEYRPHTRSSDKELLLAIWEKEGFNLDESQKKIFLNNCTSAESITRARRKFRKQYPGTDVVEQQRFDRFETYRSGGIL